MIRSHEPMVHVVKRDDIVWWKAWCIRLSSVLISLVVCGFIIYSIVKMNPVDVYIEMFKGAFGRDYRTWVTIRDCMMLLCIGVGLAPAFKMRFWNIGAEGQILVGGIAAAACMIYIKNLSNWQLLIVMAVTSAICGAIWGLIPAVFKAQWNTNETLFTLMMNYMAIQLTSYFVALWENPFGSNSVGTINPVTELGWFPKILGKQYLLNVILVVTLALIIYIYLKFTKHGYEISVVGESEKTAKYVGINVKKVIIRTMILSGAICGLAGFLAVGGASQTISTDTAGGKGFTAIIVAWLAKFNTIAMSIIALMIVFLQKGASQIASTFNLSDFASQMITGIILFFILGSEFFINYKLKFRGKTAREEN